MKPAFRAAVLRSLLAVALMLGGIAIYYHVRIAPLRQQQSEAGQQIAIVRGHLEAAQRELGKIKTLEQERWRFRQHLNALHEDSPVAPAVTWFPARMKAHLARYGVGQAEIRLNTIESKSCIAGFDRSYWHVKLPPQPGLRKMTDALLAVAQFEQHDRFVKIVDLNLRAQPGEASVISGDVNVTAFLRK